MSDFEALDQAAFKTGFWVKVLTPWKPGREYRVIVTQHGYAPKEKPGPVFAGNSFGEAAADAIEWLRGTHERP